MAQAARGSGRSGENYDIQKTGTCIRNVLRKINHALGSRSSSVGTLVSLESWAKWPISVLHNFITLM